VHTGNHIFSNKDKGTLILHTAHSENVKNMTQWDTGYATAYFRMKDLKFFDRVFCEADLLFAFTHFTQTDRHSQ